MDLITAQPLAMLPLRETSMTDIRCTGFTRSIFPELLLTIEARKYLITDMRLHHFDSNLSARMTAIKHFPKTSSSKETGQTNLSFNATGLSLLRMLIGKAS